MAKQAIITSVTPRSVNCYSGAQMVITGSGFTGVSRVFVENVNFKQWDAQFTVNSSTQITMTMPVASTGGTMHIFVVANGQENAVPQVGVLESDGDYLTSAGTGGVNWTTEAGPAAQIWVDTTPASFQQMPPLQPGTYQIYDELLSYPTIGMGNPFGAGPVFGQVVADQAWLIEEDPDIQGHYRLWALPSRLAARENNANDRIIGHKEFGQLWRIQPSSDGGYTIETARGTVPAQCWSLDSAAPGSPIMLKPTQSPSQGKRFFFQRVDSKS
ncbi:IPT/TIG domain-containing protein [Nocardia sp. NPDC060259]|uniref:IPT/TIG domain-containing protein n=1 Tax=Nocardia sp. NPDC060259 TaxID=3347088 RepID=UPI0036699DDB